MKTLFETARLGNPTPKNRLVRSATCEGIALPDGGIDTYDRFTYGAPSRISPHTSRMAYKCGFVINMSSFQL